MDTHSFVLTADSDWAVAQQGMTGGAAAARRRPAADSSSCS